MNPSFNSHYRRTFSKAIAYAKVLADELELVGTLAVEMFATADGDLY